MLTRLTKLALVLGLGIVPLIAQSVDSPKAGAGPHQSFMLGRMADQLKLTEDQKVQIQAIHTRHAGEGKTKAQAAAGVRKTFQDAMQNPDTTAAQLKPLYQAKSDAEFELLLDRRARQSEIRAVLTPDQRIQWDKWQAYHMGMKRGRMMSRRGF